MATARLSGVQVWYDWYQVWFSLVHTLELITERCLSATVDGSRMQEHIMIGVFLLHVVTR